MKLDSGRAQRKRVQTKIKGKSLTDQSFKNGCDINLIIEKYRKTGVLPNFADKGVGAFLDTTEIPSFLEAYEMVSRAKELFMELPSVVRKAMDNNPANLENFIQDSNNHEFLMKHGVIEIKKKPQPKRNLTDADIEALAKKGVFASSKKEPQKEA